MTDDNKDKDQSVKSTETPDAVSEAKDRSALMEHARIFLISPAIRTSTIESKREFLLKKGLTNSDIEQLLIEQINSPAIPPRTYPQPAPSRLPDFFLVLTKLTAWLIGASGVAAVIYYTVLLPRISKTLRARHAATSKQIEHLTTLITSTKKLETAQQRADQALESDPSPIKLQDIPLTSEGRPALPYRVLIRSIIVSSPNGRLSLREVITRMEQTFPSLTSEKNDWPTLIQKELNRDVFFKRLIPPTLDDTASEPEHLYAVTESPTADPYVDRLHLSLPKLSVALGKLLNAHRSEGTTNTPASRTLQSLTDFTAYLSSQTYAIPSGYLATFGNRSQRTLGAAEEEVRKDIRSIKGLMLNRRTFANPIVNAQVNGFDKRT